MSASHRRRDFDHGEVIVTSVAAEVGSVRFDPPQGSSPAVAQWSATTNISIIAGGRSAVLVVPDPGRLRSGSFLKVLSPMVDSCGIYTDFEHCVSVEMGDVAPAIYRSIDELYYCTL